VRNERPPDQPPRRYGLAYETYAATYPGHNPEVVMMWSTEDTVAQAVEEASLMTRELAILARAARLTDPDPDAGAVEALARRALVTAERLAVLAGEVTDPLADHFTDAVGVSIALNGCSLLAVERVLDCCPRSIVPPVLLAPAVEYALAASALAERAAALFADQNAVSSLRYGGDEA
jgi:hypothetical protein